MKKLIIVIALIIPLVSTICSAQTVIKKYFHVKGMDFSKKSYIVQLDNNCLYKINNLDNYNRIQEGDLVDTASSFWKDVAKYEGKINLSGQSIINAQDTSEIKAKLMSVQKIYEETLKQKIQKLKELFENQAKELEATDPELLRMQGIILYLNEEYNIEKNK